MMPVPDRPPSPADENEMEISKTKRENREKLHKNLEVKLSLIEICAKNKNALSSNKQMNGYNRDSCEPKTPPQARAGKAIADQ